MLANDHYSFNGKATDYAARFYVVFESMGGDEPDPDDPNEDDGK